MDTNKIIEYLSQFSGSSKISIIVANPSRGIRELYPIEGFHALEKDKDIQEPCFVVEVGSPKPLEIKL